MLTIKEQSQIDKAIQILKSKLNKNSIKITGSESAKNLCVLELSALKIEKFCGLLLATDNTLIDFVTFSKGTIDSAHVYAREVVKICLEKNAKSIIFTHNHPSGFCEPSEADKAITQQLKKALGLLEISTLDHIIVGATKTFAFSENGLM